MGFLSTLLTIGGAVAGSFVGAPGLGASIGGAIGGAIDQSSASDDAAKAQEAAQQQAIALRTAAANNIAGVQQPYTNFGIASTNALTSRLGLGAPQIPIPSTPSGTVATNAQGQPVAPSAAAPASISPPNALTGTLSGIQTAGAVSPAIAASAKTIDPATGLASGLQPAATIDPSTGLTRTTSASVAAPAGTLTGTMTDPVTAPAPVPAPVAAPTATTGVDPGTFGSTANPTAPGAYSAPAPFTYSMGDYTASPGYQYQQDQAAKATLANASATGALQSGAAMKALQDRAQQIAYTDFTNERAFADQLYNTNTNNALNAYDTNYNAYNNDRNYLTNRFDTQTNNLFKGVGIGQQGAGVVSNADLNVANGNATSATQIGNIQGTNALTQGQIGSNTANGLVAPVSGLVSNGINALTGGGSSFTGANTDPTINLTTAQVPGLNLSGSW